MYRAFRLAADGEGIAITCRGPIYPNATTNHSVFDYGHHFDCGLGCVFDIKKDPAVSCHDMAAIGVAFFPRWQRYRGSLLPGPS